MQANKMNVLVTGSGGLIGSEAVKYFARFCKSIHGIDNNMRRFFLGSEGDVTWNLDQLRHGYSNYRHHEIDIRDRKAVFELFAISRFDLVVHCAAQPSHDVAARMPIDDFETNVVGTFNLLEASRQHCSDAVFIHCSSNKVYGDAVNHVPLVETASRYDFDQEELRNGISESFRIDQSLHSLYGASKLAADTMAQEYGRYYDMPIGVFRLSCVTGSFHSATESHGFLAYLIRCAVRKRPYRVFGYLGKQVRDQIHSSDVVAAFREFADNPRKGEVYNIGGGRQNSLSIVETFSLLESKYGLRTNWEFFEKPRRGDHICYITNVEKFRTHYPRWSITQLLPDIVEELVKSHE